MYIETRLALSTDMSNYNSYGLFLSFSIIIYDNIATEKTACTADSLLQGTIS